MDAGGERATQRAQVLKRLQGADEFEAALRGEPIGFFRRDGPTTIPRRDESGHGMYSHLASPRSGGQRIFDRCLRTHARFRAQGARRAADAIGSGGHGEAKGAL